MTAHELIELNNISEQINHIFKMYEENEIKNILIEECMKSYKRGFERGLVHNE